MAKTDMTTDRTFEPVSAGGSPRFAVYLPLAVFLGLAVLFAYGLTRNREIRDQIPGVTASPGYEAL